MKRTSFYLLSLLALIAIATSCERKYDAPLITEPMAEGVTANLTIAEFKKQYQDVPDRGDKLIDVDYVLKGIVVGNDISGNIYKQIYIQDETGGISIGADQNNISGDYYIGQEVFVKLHGLSAVKYGGQLQVGMKGTQANRLPYELFKQHVLRNKWPKEEYAKPMITTIAELNDSHVGMLVQLDNVYFKEGGKQSFAPAQKQANRMLFDANGKSIIVRNSGFADFAADILPEGHGSVKGILSKFGKDYQLFLRSKADLFNFVPGTPTPGTPTPGTPTPSEPNPSNPAPNNPVPANPVPPSGNENGSPKVTGNLLFKGADFNNWSEFESSLNKYKLALTEQSTNGGINGSGAARFKGNPTENKYFFTSLVPDGFDASKATKITFYLKGNATGKSISVNVYNTNKEILYYNSKTKKQEPAGYVAYNLGDLTTDKTFKASTKNSYTGSITTNDWVKVTLELVTEDGKKVTLPNKAGDSLIAFKYGGDKKSTITYDILLDEIRYE